MADHNVTIDADGNPDPEHLGTVKSGDTVTFTADGDDAVLCMPDASLFGGTRYEIPDGSSVTLTAQSGASSGGFIYTVSVGDLDAKCGGNLGGGEGGGEMEGGG